MTAKPLTATDRTFVAGRVAGLSQADAWRAAFPARSERMLAKTVNQKASRLATSGNIRQAIMAGQEAAARRADVNADRVLTELARLAFADIADYEELLRADIVDLAGLPPGVSRAISELIVETYVEGRGDDAQAVRRLRVKLHPKQPALEALAKYLKLYGVERLEVTDPDGKPLLTGAVDELMSRMQAIAARVAVSPADGENGRVELPERTPEGA